MKQIINIQLGGRSIAIEDSAYWKVQDYLNGLRQHFKNEPGCDEILSDIEGRFSELMNEKLRMGATHVTELDVEEMIGIMGRPEDFETSEAAEDEKPFGTGSFSSNRRLYRDNNNKMIGGVCSGLANWINIDPTIARVIFAIISLGSFGTGIFIYLLLWIFLPAKNLVDYKGKRLFRNPDNKWLGGVASGFAAYFGKEVNTIRLLMSLPLILSILNAFRGWGFHSFPIFPSFIFGSLTGTFIIIYIILWIVLPEAISPYEKMEMKGQPVDLFSIKKNVQGSLGDVKNRLHSWSREVQDSATRFGKTATTAGPGFGRDLGTAAGRGARGLGHALAVIIKVFFMIFFGAIVFSLFIGLMALVFSGYAFAPINNFLWTNDNQQFLAWGTILLFIGAPIIGSVVWLFRKILNVTTPGNYLGWLFGGLWTLGWIFLFVFIASITKDFKRSQVVEQPLGITQPLGEKLILKVTQPELTYEGDFSWMHSNHDAINGLSLTKDTLKISDVALFFEKSPDSLFHVSVVRQSLGQTESEAIARAQQIQYTPVLTDSVLDLPSGFAISKNSKYRLQGVVVNVLVPVGKKIELDPSVQHRLNPVEIDFNNADYRKFRRWERRRYNQYESGVVYTMQADGQLTRLGDGTSKNTKNNNGTYRWEEGSQDSLKKAQTPPDSIDRVGYRFDADSITASESKEALRKALIEKEKELEALKKKLNQ